MCALVPSEMKKIRRLFVVDAIVKVGGALFPQYPYARPILVALVEFPSYIFTE